MSTDTQAPTRSLSLTHLEQLEAESIYILREVAACFERPVLLYSIGKDSSVLLRLSQKAFYPQKVPFTLLHVDTGFKFPEMISFRDRSADESELELVVHRNETAIAAGAHPDRLGRQRCCTLLKTRALLDALQAGAHDAAIGGARRDEERSRAKERVFSFRDEHGQWTPRAQRPELWNVYNTRVREGESIRVFPLSNWREIDVWHYIHREEIPVSELYFARDRHVIRRDGMLFPTLPSMATETVSCRFRSLGCHPCTGAVASRAQTVPDIMEELLQAKTSERATRMIDHDGRSAMERKKREGYF